MNLVHALIIQRAEKLILELEEVSVAFSIESSRKKQSSSVADLMAIGVVDPVFTERVASIHVQLAVLTKMIDDQ